jgi:hypothetical protein
LFYNRYAFVADVMIFVQHASSASDLNAEYCTSLPKYLISV